LRILVVDDNPDIRETLKDILELEGHEVTLAEDGDAAVACAGNGHDHDVAIVDIGLPGLDGYGVARRIRETFGPRGIFLVALTGYGQQQDRDAVMQAGFDQHLVKPIDAKTLVEILRDRRRLQTKLGPRH
jgi:CheY-like chemotaxis protein